MTYFFNPLRTNPTKWSNTLRQFVGKLPTNCLSVFDHFVGLVLKGLRTVSNCCWEIKRIQANLFDPFSYENIRNTSFTFFIDGSKFASTCWVKVCKWERATLWSRLVQVKTSKNRLLQTYFTQVQYPRLLLSEEGISITKNTNLRYATHVNG